MNTPVDAASTLIVIVGPMTVKTTKDGAPMGAWGNFSARLPEHAKGWQDGTVVCLHARWEPEKNCWESLSLVPVLAHDTEQSVLDSDTVEKNQDLPQAENLSQATQPQTPSAKPIESAKSEAALAAHKAVSSQPAPNATSAPRRFTFGKTQKQDQSAAEPQVQQVHGAVTSGTAPRAYAVPRPAQPARPAFVARAPQPVKPLQPNNTPSTVVPPQMVHSADLFGADDDIPF